MKICMFDCFLMETLFEFVVDRGDEYVIVGPTSMMVHSCCS